MSSGAESGGPAGGAGLARLTENEQKLVAKLLSDPTFFPIEFRTWLKQFIEGSGIIITASQVQGGQGTNIATGLPPGVIIPCGAASAVPADCLVCDGRAVVRTDYPLLFNAIGVAWGAGDGATTFNLPDLRDRAIYGAGALIGVGTTDGVAFGSRGGPNHHHNVNQSTNTQGSHSHSVSVSGSTNTTGSHQHPPTNQNFAETTGGTAQGAAGTAWTRYNVTDYHFYTAAAGDHSHTVSASGNTDSQGSHSHSLNGPTDGGYALVPSWAGAIYVISIGTSA